MRLLIISQYFWPETFIINELAHLLKDRQVEVTVLTGKPNYPGGKIFDGYNAWGVEREDFGGVEVVRLPIAPRGANSRLRLAVNYASFVIAASVLGPFLLRGRAFDAVFVYGTSPLIKALAGIGLARLKKAPLLVWVQDLWPESLSATGYVNNRPLLALVGLLARIIYRCADVVLIQSPAFRERVADYCKRPEKIVYYPNLYLAPQAAEPSASAVLLAERLRGRFSVVFAGNIGVAQDPEVIIEAARRLQSDPDISLVLVGSGSRDKWVAERAAQLGLENLVLAGRFAPTDMEHIYAAASALLVILAPHPVFALTVPSKIQAYLAAGRPIVGALDGEAARTIAEAEAGICVAAGHPDELAEAIRKLRAMSPSEREAMGVRGRNYFLQHFEPDKLANDLIAHLRRAIKSKENAT